jgi:hypothetical protein
MLPDRGLGHHKPKHTMNTKDIFNLIVRLVGLFFIYLAAREVPMAFGIAPGQLFFPVILTVAFYVGVGWWLVGGAPLLAKRAYPETSDQQPAKDYLSQNIPWRPICAAVGLVICLLILARLSMGF